MNLVSKVKFKNRSSEGTQKIRDRVLLEKVEVKSVFTSNFQMLAFSNPQKIPAFLIFDFNLSFLRRQSEPR
jgi:hypothetical protein